MPSSITQTTIADRALQLLGYQAISSTQQVGSKGARAMNRAYPSTKLSELTKNNWAFAIKRATLPASGTKPVHTKTNAFELPTDYLMLAPPDQFDSFQLRNDWTIEGKQIISDDSGPILIRYVANIDESFFDAVFAEALSCALAISTCEELTNSNSKLANLISVYQEQISVAKRRGAILSQKPTLPLSPWISMRG